LFQILLDGAEPRDAGTTWLCNASHLNTPCRACAYSMFHSITPGTSAHNMFYLTAILS